MRKSTTILTTAVLVIVMGLLLVVYLQGNASEPVSGDMTIELYDAPATIHRGNLTVWTNDGGKWTYTTTANGGHTTWVFKGLTNMTSRYDMLTAAASIAARSSGPYDTWLFDRLSFPSRNAKNRANARRYACAVVAVWNKIR